MPTANHVSRQVKLDKQIQGDLWIEWTGSKGTFCLKRNDGLPVFPLDSSESNWVRQQIGRIFNLPF